MDMTSLLIRVGDNPSLREKPNKSIFGRSKDRDLGLGPRHSEGNQIAMSGGPFL
jgi:hypothetical protein